MVQDLYIGQGVLVGLNKNKIFEGFDADIHTSKTVIFGILSVVRCAFAFGSVSGVRVLVGLSLDRLLS